MDPNKHGSHELTPIVNVDITDRVWRLEEIAVCCLEFRSVVAHFGTLGGITRMETISTTESRISRLWPEIAKATSTSERLRRVADFFDACEVSLLSPDRQTRYDVFYQVSNLLSERICDAEIWDWLQEVARSADLEHQIDMRIAVFELVPDAPIIWSDFFRLWDMWFDPQARWLFTSLTNLFPDAFISTCDDTLHIVGDIVYLYQTFHMKISTRFYEVIPPNTPESN